MFTLTVGATCLLYMFHAGMHGDPGGRGGSICVALGYWGRVTEKGCLFSHFSTPTTHEFDDNY